MKNNWITLLSLLLSIIAILIAGVRLEPVKWGIDATNLLVDVLALLVTVLIGWQIYNVIEVKKQMDNVNEKIKEYNEAIPDLYSCIFFVQAFSRRYTEPFSAYKDYIRSLTRALSINESIAKNPCIRELRTTIQYIQDCGSDKYSEFYNDLKRQKEVIKQSIEQLKLHKKYREIRIEFEEIDNNRNAIEKQIELWIKQQKL